MANNTGLTDITSIRNYINLRMIYLDGCTSLSNILVLEQFRKLHTLSAQGCLRGLTSNLYISVIK